MWEQCDEVTLSLLLDEKTQLVQSFLIDQVLQPFDNLHGPPLDLLQSICIFLDLWGPELDTKLQMWPAKG